MSKLITFAVLASASLPALALPTGQAPVPAALPLLGIGVLAVVLAKRLK